jgi:hypothetical protein
VIVPAASPIVPAAVVEAGAGVGTGTGVALGALLPEAVGEGLGVAVAGGTTESLWRQPAKTKATAATSTQPRHPGRTIIAREPFQTDSPAPRLRGAGQDEGSIRNG